ncbi:uncharacterized protein L969DRAFT_88737 [Mixia osmundae IAM 14324]|uniref:MICOS complex subunit n=1 Tax=Mixia osmundae (strain CBS 9802 / IAM 14324 / JCM 22182 / KY 12970) TaxID=764103 RepID=G7DZ85_MIXOS|nr:uncharacterized protein L969DRAFT_88737 [Mixia osmundae IAM 14324]KEI38297.1 hypothetical protein L969DRAFT_88737 [Mixia osmundae IAM 14324]GAA95895.1 hypothetical protein E5Q_02553 [Mixia osmundae IAM 14324]
MEQPRRKSIYDQPSGTIELEERPVTALQRNVGVARQHLQSFYAQTVQASNKTVDSLLSAENQLAKEAKAIRAPNEPLTPHLLYVGIAALTGSILTRNRNILLRLTIPPLFLFGSASYLLPATTQNLVNRVSELEHRHAPGFARSQDAAFGQARQSLGWAQSRIEKTASDAKKRIEYGSQKAEELSGLKFTSALDKTEARLEQYKDRAIAKGKEIKRDAEAKEVQIKSL